MGLRLVNLSPGSVSDYIKPSQPIQMGLKSDGLSAYPLGSVVLGSLRVSLGYSSVQNEGVLPESSVVLGKVGAVVGLDTAEKVRPIGSEVTRAPFGNGIKLTAPGTASPVGLYSVRMPIANDAAVLGYFKFKSNTSWSLASRDWCNLSLMTGMYFGLEYGPLNTICWASLRGSPGGAGSLVIGGPMQLFSTARPAQQQINAFNWLAQPNGTILEMWIVFSQVGYDAPFFPANTPILEVWTKIDGVDALPVWQTQVSPVPSNSLGQFPTQSSGFPNYRSGPSDFATLYFGNVGSGSDALEIMDWALFPDYRVAVKGGLAVGDNRFTPRGDGAWAYSCLDGKPQDVVPGRWFSMPDAGFQSPGSSLFYSPGRSTPTFVTITKGLSGGAGFQRVEPRLSSGEDGAVVEAFLSAERIQSSNDSVGSGLSLDDGTNLFQVIMLQSTTRRTIGIYNGGPVGNLASGYFTPNPALDGKCDWRSLKFVRLVVDRVRSRVALYVDGIKCIDESLASMPASTSPVGGRVAFGHLEPSTNLAKLNVAFLSYNTRYVAWEVSDSLLPPASPSAFTLSSSGTAAESLTASELVIHKMSFNTVGSHVYYSKPLPTFDERHCLQVEFKARVTDYTDLLGAAFASNVWVGSGIQVLLGNKKLHLGFFDCGANGRMLGVVPGSGNIEDIINQTVLGREFSTPLNWVFSTLVRLVYHPYHMIEIFIDNIPSGPVLTIPWRNDTDGFDLPAYASSESIAFGHFDGYSSSATNWEYFRYSVGNGYEVAVEPLFPDGLKGYLFGGRILVQTEFNE